VTTAAFRDRYGPWALVAGASEGLGAAWATALADRGLDLVLCGRRPAPLEAFAATLRTRYGVDVRAVVCDLAAPDATATLEAATAGLEVGLLVYNAALSPIGPFLDQDAARLAATLATNCGTPVLLAHLFGRAMRARGRGGIVLMGSLSGLQGSARLATYAATKAFTLVLAEGIARECRPAGVDVLACIAGATRTPGYLATRASGTRPPPGELSPDAVVREAIDALGRRAFVIPGAMNRFSAFVLTRLLPRKIAVEIISRSTERLEGAGGRS
jgi:short-subunit dehydrogenase